MKIALSLLCEQPDRKTGLTSLFTAFVRETLQAYPDAEFVLFCAQGQDLGINSPRVKVAGGYSANNRLFRRLYCEHFLVGPAAKRLGCDVLLTTGLVPLLSPIPVAMHLLTLHHLNPENKLGWLRSTYRKWASTNGLDKAGLIITNTRFACNQILPVDPKSSAKLLQSYEGIDHSVFHAEKREPEAAMLKERFGIEGGYFFWCSNFYPYKQAELMMEAWCDLPQSTREETPLVMVGGSAWGDSKEKTIEIAMRRGAMDQVKMLGWVSDEEVPILFRHASVFVHPSREETFGRSVLEAMASGVPSVVQGIPVMNEVTGGHALIIDYNDRAAATAAMEEALGNSDTRQRLIDGGIARAREFSFRRLAIERIEALRTMIGLPPTENAKTHPPKYATDIS
jgi:glycosyltransferase involved in cell wall biosynthesis